MDDTKSTSGYFYSLGLGVFSWSAKKKQVVSQSSAKAEYISTGLAMTQQTICLKRILEDFGENKML